MPSPTSSSCHSYDGEEKDVERGSDTVTIRMTGEMSSSYSGNEKNKNEGRISDNDSAVTSIRSYTESREAVVSEGDQEQQEEKEEEKLPETRQLSSMYDRYSTDLVDRSSVEFRDNVNGRHHNKPAIRSKTTNPIISPSTNTGDHGLVSVYTNRDTIYYDRHGNNITLDSDPEDSMHRGKERRICSERCVYRSVAFTMCFMIIIGILLPILNYLSLETNNGGETDGSGLYTSQDNHTVNSTNIAEGAP